MDDFEGVEEFLLESFLDEIVLDESVLDESVLDESVFEPKPTKRARNFKKCYFSVDEKKKLAELVRQNPSIWNLEDAAHKNLGAINAAWKKIATCLDKTVEDCKANWKSLRDSHRYHNAPRKLSKSGSAAGEVPQDEEILVSEENVDWEFSTCLEFLKPASSKRRTFTNVRAGKDAEDGGDSPQNVASTPATRSSYAYSTLRQPKRDVMSDNISALTDTVSTLIQMRTQAGNKPQQPPLSHYSLLSNLDRVLNKLPDEIVEELALSFQQQAVAALREHNKSRGFDFELLK